MKRCACGHRIDEHGDACGVSGCPCDMSAALLTGPEKQPEQIEIEAELEKVYA